VVACIAPQEHSAVNAAERERPATDHIGIDVHKRESQIYILAEGGEVIEQRIRTEPERFRRRARYRTPRPDPDRGLVWIPERILRMSWR
jgi:hypothetical protein